MTNIELRKFILKTVPSQRFADLSISIANWLDNPNDSESHKAAGQDIATEYGRIASFIWLSLPDETAARANIMRELGAIVTQSANIALSRLRSINETDGEGRPNAVSERVD